MRKKKYIQFEDGSVVLKKKERKIGVKELIISIVLAVMLFIGLIIAEGKLLSNYEKTVVFTAKTEIPVNTQITENNIGTYFIKTEIPVKIMPATAVKDKKKLVEKIVSEKISQGEIIVSNRFADKNEYLSSVKVPIEIGVDISNNSQFVNGIIRKGDIINISVVDSKTNENISILKNVYVSKVFDNNGVEIIGFGENKEAQALNIYIATEDEDYFNKNTATGTVYVSKVLSPNPKDNIYGLGGIQTEVDMGISDVDIPVPDTSVTPDTQAVE